MYFPISFCGTLAAIEISCHFTKALEIKEKGGVGGTTCNSDFMSLDMVYPSKIISVNSQVLTPYFDHFSISRVKVQKQH